MSDYHHLYNRAAWRNTRAAQLREHPLCRMHMELGQVVAASVVDHIQQHKGDTRLFLDSRNLQSLCKPCHDRHKQAQEHNADGLVRGAGINGRPIDLLHPWHRPAGVGGQEKSAAEALKTGPCTPFAGCHNPRGGASG